MLGDVIALDFINSTLEPETAKERRAALINAAEFEPAEMRVRALYPLLNVKPRLRRATARVAHLRGCLSAAG
jgi:hypothetical protein